MKYKIQRKRKGKTYEDLVGTYNAKIWKENQRLAQLGEKNHFFGKKHTKETKKAIGIKSIGRNTMLGKHLSIKSKKQLGASRMKLKKKQGYLVPMSARKKIAKRMKELWKNPEYIAKMNNRKTKVGKRK